MRKVLSICFFAVAGFFLYSANLIAFFTGIPTSGKWTLVLVLAAVSVVVAVIGLWLARFRNWRRDAGVILVCSSAFTAFLVFVTVCLLMSEDYRKMMPPDLVAAFGDHVAGAVMIVCTGGAGVLLLLANRAKYVSASN